MQPTPLPAPVGATVRRCPSLLSRIGSTKPVSGEVSGAPKPKPTGVRTGTIGGSPNPERERLSSSMSLARRLGPLDRTDRKACGSVRHPLAAEVGGSALRAGQYGRRIFRCHDARVLPMPSEACRSPRRVDHAPRQPGALGSQKRCDPCDASGTWAGSPDRRGTQASTPAERGSVAPDSRQHRPYGKRTGSLSAPPRRGPHGSGPSAQLGWIVPSPTFAIGLDILHHRGRGACHVRGQAAPAPRDFQLRAWQGERKPNAVEKGRHRVVVPWRL